MHYTSKAVYEYISKKVGDSIVERKQCRLSNQSFPIYQSDLDFYDKISPKFEVSADYAKKFLEENKDIAQNFEYKDGKLKCKIPTPTLCPEERQRRRLAFRNTSKLYQNNGKISVFSPDKKVNAVSQEDWFGGKVDGIEQGLAYDQNQSFTEIFKKLQATAPRWESYITNGEKIFWSTNIDNANTTYLSSAIIDSEKVFFSQSVMNSDNIFDSFIVDQSDNLYNSVNILGSGKIYSSSNLVNCHNCILCEECVGCTNCIACHGLVNQEYMIFNKKVDRTIFEQERKKTQGDYTYFLQIQGKYQQLPKIQSATKSENSEQYYGDEVYNSRAIKYTYNSNNSEDVAYSIRSARNENIYDSYNLEKSQHGYEISTSYMTYNSSFVFNVAETKNCYYSETLVNCEDCFACVGLKDKQYCIFNTQYSKEAYNQLVPKIIAQMIREKQRGEFFDSQFSPFGYNETDARFYMSIEKEEALKLGYKRSDYEAPFPKVEKFVQGKKLRTASCKLIHEQKPELLEKLLNYAVVCEVSGKPFRIIKQEIDFYIKHNLPLPRKHPDVRHQERMDKRPGRILYLRNCDKCSEEMLSVYSSSGGSAEGSSIQQIDSSLCSEGQRAGLSADKAGSEGQKIYCEKCYQKEIYG